MRKLLLIPHCLRNPVCKGFMSRKGLVCGDCKLNCIVQLIKDYAIAKKFVVCVAGGGTMAIQSFKDNNPELVVAIACYKELDEGTHAIQNICWKDNKQIPEIKQIQLLKDGCYNTDVSMEQVYEVLNQ